MKRLHDLTRAGSVLGILASVFLFSPPASGQNMPKVLVDGDPEYGEYLSSQCQTCHQADGSDDGIPSIKGLRPENFYVAIRAYKTKKRPNQVMQTVAGALDEEQMAALAAYFATLE